MRELLDFWNEKLLEVVYLEIWNVANIKIVALLGDMSDDITIIGL